METSIRTDIAVFCHTSRDGTKTYTTARNKTHAKRCFGGSGCIEQVGVVLRRDGREVWVTPEGNSLV